MMTLFFLTDEHTIYCKLRQRHRQPCGSPTVREGPKAATGTVHNSSILHGRICGPGRLIKGSAKMNGENIEELHIGSAKRPAAVGSRLKVGLAILAVLGLVVAGKVLPLGEYAGNFQNWVTGLGLLGPVAVIVLYIIACVLLVPGLILTVVTGAIFGVVYGTMIVSVGSTLGAAAAFLTGRHLARGWVTQKIGSGGRFATLDQAIEREGFRIVLLTRLAPVFPFNLLNYAYGLTRVRFSSYFFASWIGMLPGTVLYVYLGTAFGSFAKFAAEGREKTTGETLFLWGGLAVAILVVGYVTRLAKKAFDLAVAAEPEAENYY
ncbi:TVP38/TMEM64 family protein [Candidatus Sumerlaeota bacterium]